MKEFKNDVIGKEYQKFQNTIFIGLGIIFLAVVFLGYSIFKDDKNSISLQELILNNPVENKIGYVDTIYEPFRFAYYEGESNYFYFLFDKENYMYVVRMSNKDYEKFKENSSEKKEYRVEGVTKKLPEDIKKIGVEVYNEDLFPDSPIKQSEANDYFGTIYIDLNALSTTDTITIICGIIIIVGAIVLLVGGFKKYKYSKNIKKLTEEERRKLDEELNDEKSFYYKSAHVYLTKNYIFNLAQTFEVIPYKDIIWIYPFEVRNRGVKVGQNIQVMTKDGKKRTIAYLTTYTKKNQEIFNEIYESLSSKNENMLQGYTKENQQKAKEKIQKLK